ncbi:MAG: type II toxin-antitoxin system PemK/MazF family toxin [Deinococcota bacterium]
MTEGDVVLVPLPQVDGQLKVRPCLVLRVLPPFNDLLVCGISTQLQHEVKGFDDVVLASDRDFIQSGLRATSLIRLGFLGVIPTSQIAGSIGSIDSQRHQNLLKRLANFLIGNIT